MTQITSLDKLLSFRQNRLSDKTIILVTGVFDLLHTEHKKFLKKAKEQGDVLLVGVETDERVKKLKGPNRPVWKLEKRLKEIAKLAYVNYTFPLPKKFNHHKNHENLIEKLKPSILAVSVNTPRKDSKKKLIEKYGGKIKVVLPHNSNVSTTKIIKENNY